MPLSGQIKAHGKLLKLPLAVTAAALLGFAGVAFVMHRLKPAAKPTVVEATSTAAMLGRIVFYRDGDDYAMYFSLYDTANREIARTGEASVKIAQLGTIGLEGGPDFVSETAVLDAKFEVGLSSYVWIDVGRGLFFERRQLVVPRKVPAKVFTKLPRGGAKCKITVEFRAAKAPGEKVQTSRIFLFP